MASSPSTASDWAQRLGGELLGDGQWPVLRLASLEAADANSIAFLADATKVQRLLASDAGCVILAPALLEQAQVRVSRPASNQAQAQPQDHAGVERAHGRAAILCADPYLAFARLTQLWASQQAAPWLPGIHPSAVVEEGAVIHPSAQVGPLAFVGAGAKLGEGARLLAQAHLGAYAQLGAGSCLMPRAVLSEHCTIASNGLIHSGAVVGADGFGFAPAGAGAWEKIAQLGAVRIGHGVEIGANTCIDRGALEDTVIEDGVKIDNLVQIGHNVHIGAHTAIAGCVGIAGSARIGKRCRLGGAAMILGHLSIADDVVVTSGTLISRSVAKPGVYSGAFPFDDNAAWEKNAATLRQLHSLRERIRALENKA